MPPPRDDDGPALDPVHHAASGAARRRLATRAPLKHTLSSQDALSGDPSRAAMASCAAGIIQGCLLLPMNTVQTQMQTRGKSIPATLRSLFEGGTLSGVHNLYRALLPTVGMLGARQGLKFGSGAVYKQRLPTTWPEPARDACAGGLSALTSTTLLFPLDTLKTRWQMGMPGPSAGQAYNGFRPAASYSVFGMALWLVSRNALERNIPDPPSGSALAYWKHFFCGGMAGVMVQVPTFPFDTLKKRLQASDDPRTVVAEARVLLKEGGLLRFYRGFTLKCGFVALNGAIFNTVFVAVRKALKVVDGT